MVQSPRDQPSDNCPADRPAGEMVDAVGRSMHDAIGVQSMPKVYPEYA